MDRTSDFLREFQASLDELPLPEAAARDYRLESCLAEGSQGSVWLLRRREDGERFILRVSRERDLREEFETLRRLPRELAGQVPAAVGLWEEDGVQYLVRSYLPGRPLAEVWEAGERSESRCIRLGMELCALLDRLHRLSPPVIHRDVKPENIILAPDGAPGLIDFGIARGYDPGREADTVCMGTRATAAPEQYGFSQSDQRTDLYALGVTLRWMVTGSYRSEDLEAAECSPAMKRFLRKATAFDPADRYPSASAMAEALRRTAAGRKRVLLPCLAAAIAVCLLACLLAVSANARRPVDFDSPLLEQAVRLELNRPEGTITRRDLKQVRRLAVVGQNVLEPGRDYQYRLCGFLDGVSQEGAPFGDISDLSLLAEMPDLRVLYLCQQKISDLAPLSDLPLRELYLCDNEISDLSPLKGMGSLETLYLGTNPLGDLTPLASLGRLRTLNLDNYTFGWPVDSLAPLAELELETLSAGLIEPLDGDWSPLGQLPKLERLWLWDPSDDAVQALADCEALRYLHMGNYRHADLTGLPVIPALTELYTYNRLSSLVGIGKQAGLTTVNLCNHPGIDLSPLEELPGLQYLSFYGCPQVDYDPLNRCAALVRVEVRDTQEAAGLEAACPERVFEIYTH